ncbi:hypothetical protein [Marinifilum sp. D714]|uniref:hypothetical protein n=1 Tax=Marinifilum sp. D714 TaxID=2937523 RepID=UPI0027C23331|nr:hypothetical protein [Marinifilum sp. D714]MDQ2180301.1 hypothetical protein [Marinifilum sp. D714]
MKNKTYIIIFFLFTSISCKEKVPLKIDPEQHTPVVIRDSLYSQLAKSLSKNNESLYTKFLVDWNRKFQPNGVDFINQNEVSKSIFAIFKAIYQPKDIDELGSWQKDYSGPQNYYVIQNTIKFYIDGSNVDTITNFRPPTDLPKSSILYTSSIHQEIYNTFLNKLGKKDDNETIQEVNPNATLSNDDLKIKRIEKYFPIDLDSNLKHWNIISAPYIRLISFNENIDRAKVDFIVGCQGGEAILKKKNNKWIILESKATWIE